MRRIFAISLLLLSSAPVVACGHGHSGESFKELDVRQQQAYFQGVLAAKDIACPNRTKDHLRRANITLLGFLATAAKPTECIAKLIDEKISVDGCPSLEELAKRKG